MGYTDNDDDDDDDDVVQSVGNVHATRKSYEFPIKCCTHFEYSSREAEAEKTHVFAVQYLFFFSFDSLSHQCAAECVCVSGGCIEIFIKLMDGIKSFAHAQN